jgi:hypothetical protein
MGRDLRRAANQNVATAIRVALANRLVETEGILAINAGEILLAARQPSPIARGSRDAASIVSRSDDRAGKYEAS